VSFSFFFDEIKLLKFDKFYSIDFKLVHK